MPGNASILELLKIVAPVLPAPIYWEDVNSVLLGGNEAVFSATGAKLAEAYVGKTLFELYPADMAEHIKRHNDIRTPLSGIIGLSPCNNEIPCITLLLVEDNSIALRMIEVYTEKLGCRYISVTNGEEALEIAKSADFDLIITDIGLPGLSGNELTREIRAWEKSLNKPPKPIIGLTAHGLMETESESKQAGMNHVLSKPIKLEVLKSILTQFLPEQLVIPSAKQVLAVDALDTEKKLLDEHLLLNTKEEF